MQMADEQVFLGSDVSQLVNGLKLPLMMAFSCTIGDFANPAGKSLAEKLLLRDGGGAIATVTASRESYPSPNERVCFKLFEVLFPGRLERRQLPVGVALMQAKLWGQLDAQCQPVRGRSSRKRTTGSTTCWAIPRCGWRSPQQEIRFETARAGHPGRRCARTLRGVVYSGGAVIELFDGTVFVTVREPQFGGTIETRCACRRVDYLLPGGPIYQGTVDAVDGRFE